MSAVYFDVPANSTLPIFFDSFDSNGASVTISGLVVTDIEIYKGTSMTQRASDNGYALIDTDGIDIDGIAGVHGFSIDLSDNSDAGFYAVGSYYNVVVSTVTVSAQTVSFIAARFRIVAAEHTAGYPVATIKDGTGTGELDTASGVVLAKDHTGANLATAAALDAVDNFVDTEIADIQSRLPAALVSGRIDASVGAMAPNTLTATAIAADAITAAKVADGTIDAATFASGAITADAIAANAIGASELAADAVTEIQSGLSTLDGAGVRTAVGLASANLDTQLAAIDDYVDTEVAAIKSDTTAIRAKTDSLAFTVANQVDCNIQSVNDVTVNGAGTAGSPWGP